MTRAKNSSASMFSRRGKAPSGRHERFWEPSARGEAPGSIAFWIGSRRKIRILYEQLLGWTGSPTDDQKAQIPFFDNGIQQLGPRVAG